MNLKKIFKIYKEACPIDVRSMLVQRAALPRAVLRGDPQEAEMGNSAGASVSMFQNLFPTSDPPPQQPDFIVHLPRLILESPGALVG